MKNVYQDSDMCYSEIATVLEDFTYGEMCKFSIPSINPLINMNTHYINRTIKTSNIMNKNKKSLGISKYTVSNYIELKVPLHLSNIDNDGKRIINGKKGDKFIITFIEGDINKCKIIGRYE